jgi:hypothetical protein
VIALQALVRRKRTKNPVLLGQQGGANQDSARSHRALRRAYHRSRDGQFTIRDLRNRASFVCIGSARTMQECLWAGTAMRLCPARQNGVWLMKLTHDSIRAIAPVPPRTETIVFDDEVPGFGVRASMSGSKVFVVQYTIGNQQRHMSLGKIDMLEVDTARQKAKQILTAVRMGRDPAGDKKRPSRV